MRGDGFMSLLLIFFKARYSALIKNAGLDICQDIPSPETPSDYR